VRRQVEIPRRQVEMLLMERDLMEGRPRGITARIFEG
jgi:hypothetical protein